jgi:MFS family permease
MADQSGGRMTGDEKPWLFAASIGTAFEWYDFMLFGTVAPVMAKLFFANTDPATGLILALLAFSAGFIVRPLGALVFGRLGDRAGRKYTFLVTIVVMGIATFLVGLLPTFETWGIAAPFILIFLRLVQGLAVGGEYGGAAIYVAENAPARRRGYFTSWIQATGSVGLLLSVLVVLCTRTVMGEEAFAHWGWRVPFLLSSILLVISVWMRLAMDESPVFARLKAQGRTSKAPIAESLGQWRNVRWMLIALFGLIGAFASLWYAAHLYVMLFLSQTLKVAPATTNLMMCVTMIIATPFYLVFGALSDRIGRKPVILAGMVLGVILVFPFFKLITHFANPVLETARAHSPVLLMADPADCHVQFNLTGAAKFTSSCDIAKAKLAAAAVSYEQRIADTGRIALVKVGEVRVDSYRADGLIGAQAAAKDKTFVAQLSAALQDAGYPANADPAKVNKPMVMLLVFGLILCAAMIYAPAAAIMVELFPTRIRYTSLSLPFHLGAGWIGGLMPASAFALVAWRGDIYSGLWYPVAVLFVSIIVCALFMPETRGAGIDAESPMDAAPGGREASASPSLRGPPEEVR